MVGEVGGVYTLVKRYPSPDQGALTRLLKSWKKPRVCFKAHGSITITPPRLFVS